MTRRNFYAMRHELNKLSELPPWGRPQGDNWDRLSNFIYQTATLPEVRQQAQAKAATYKLDAEAFEAYAIRRWYNHHTHDQILQMFLAHPHIEPEKNKKHRAIDFYLRGLPFDLKVSRFPHAYPHNISYAQQHPHHLALWQYQQQSKQGRYHTGNRLFIVLHNPTEPEQTWQLRRNFDTIASLILDYLDAPTLFGLTITNFQNQEVYHPWSAVIFYVSPIESE